MEFGQLRTAFIHIGVPKTGSTAIQATLDAERNQVQAQGFHYLSGDRNHSEALALAFWNRDDAQRLAGLRWHDGVAAAAHCEAVLENLTAEIDGTEKHLILSAEGLANFKAEEVSRFHRFLNDRFDKLRVIAYLRDPFDWVHSAAQQATKWSGDCLDDLFDHPRLPLYTERLDPWLRIFGRENTDLRPFRKNDIVGDFAQAVGLALPQAPASSRLNAGVSCQAAALFSHCNILAPPFVEARHNPLRAFDIIKSGRLPGRPFALPRETIETHRDALNAERDWALQYLSSDAFSAPQLPDIERADWYMGTRNALEDFAANYLQKSRATQNERALRMFLKAQKQRADPAQAIPLLDQACLLSTDRWTMDLIAQEALEQPRESCEAFFQKQRLMRRIEAPEPNDPPLLIGNPFDRPWDNQTPATEKLIA